MSDVLSPVGKIVVLWIGKMILSLSVWAALRDWVAYKAEKLKSHSSGSWKSEITVSAQSGSGESLCQEADYQFLAASSHDEKRTAELSGVLP